MNTTKKILSIALLPFLSLGVQAADLSDLANLAVLNDAAKQTQTSQRNTSYKRFFTWEEPTKVHRSLSILKRSDNAVCLSSTTAKLPEGSHTNWWMIFNNPEACTNPTDAGGKCSLADVPNPDVNTTAMWSTAGIVGPDNHGHFSACIDEGELTHHVLVGTDGLVDSHKAEIHMVIRYHGPNEIEDSKVFGEQLNSFNGGCEVPADNVDGFPCVDVQYVVHPAR